MGISYSVDVDPATSAKGMLRERPISLKHSKAIAREIRGETVADARAYLEAVVNEDRSVPFKQHNSGVGHRSDVEGWDAGRYPKKASEDFLKLIENVANNADQQGFESDGMVVAHVAPHKVGESQGRKPRAYGKADPWNTPEVDVELVVREATASESEATTSESEATTSESEATTEREAASESETAADEANGDGSDDEEVSA